MRREKIPLPNNPYSIYKSEKNGRTYTRAPFPRYIAKILNLDPEDLAESYELEIEVDRSREKIEIKLVEK